MSTNKKIKFYKNPDRNVSEDHKPYVPQYQLMGVEPTEYNSPSASGYTIAVANRGSTDNPRTPRAVIRQPYAEATPSPIGRGRGLLPNIGNNMEQTWSGVDSEIIDDISNVNFDQKMVDNNEFVSATALGLPEEVVMEEDVELPEFTKVQPNSPKPFLTQNDLQNVLNQDFISQTLKNLAEDEYLLIVEDKPLCSGPAEYIQEQTALLVFGEHKLYNNPISVDDIIVLKRTKVKVGVFLE